MKNAMQYFYQLVPEEIHQTNGVYKFELQNQYYSLYPFYGSPDSIEQIYEISLQMLQKGIYCHQIVPNQEQKLITQINGNYYILIRGYYSLEEKIKLEDIIYFSNATKNMEYKDKLRRDNWAFLWSEKIDYFEYQVNQFGKNHPIIRESFSYFVGLAETGISFLNEMKLDYKDLVISHKRTKKNQTLYDLYNPLNFIVDVRVRDVAEYFKESFISNHNIFSDIEYYLKNNYLTNYEYSMFFARMLYPSFYFDQFEEIIDHNKEDELIKPVIALATKYEELLKKIYQFLSTFISMPNIEWLKK